MAEWEKLDRPKWYREVSENTEHRYTLDQISEMSLVQLKAKEHRREELSFKEALKIIRERKAQNNVQTS